ncbi:MAG: methylmalonyl Co-A mutase-associated GTPase MeaB [Desulfatiglans sp.]|jgi:LAO/AO transport system kinase|nr:methylmalonyl Co-A mutase-associated GTPase MeaB [Thermodesulfobacteriota bacterium]MEE4354162.1 methylmalonyl Co-A mutase-associated GTPase MeaB [Desulfatiglans sp.]
MAKEKQPIAETVERLLTGNRRAAARLISMIEGNDKGVREAMKLIYPHSGQAVILGITGSGGAGKSSLTDQLIRIYRRHGKSVGVVVVDPSSPFSGGALLGDRIRLTRHSLDDGVYIRSLASRGHLGGLSRATADVIRVMEAMGKDLVIVETLGAGQDEIDVIHFVQTCLLVVTPGMGDDIQAMKAGIMEIADILVVNKADLDGATTCLRNLEAALNVKSFQKGEWVPKLIKTVAVASKEEELEGIEELVSAIGEHQAHLHDSRAIDQVRIERIEQELGLVFKEEVEKAVFQGLKGTGRKKGYINSILRGESDPYSVVNEVLNSYLQPSQS